MPRHDDEFLSVRADKRRLDDADRGDGRRQHGIGFRAREGAARVGGIGPQSARIDGTKFHN
jgi:hypothetical protein